MRIVCGDGSGFMLGREDMALNNLVCLFTESLYFCKNCHLKTLSLYKFCRYDPLLL